MFWKWGVSIRSSQTIGDAYNAKEWEAGGAEAPEDAGGGAEGAPPTKSFEQKFNGWRERLRAFGATHRWRSQRYGRVVSMRRQEGGHGEQATPAEERARATAARHLDARRPSTATAGRRLSATGCLDGAHAHHNTSHNDQVQSSRWKFIINVELNGPVCGWVFL